VNLPTVVSLLSDAIIIMKNACLEELFETCVSIFFGSRNNIWEMDVFHFHHYGFLNMVNLCDWRQRLFQCEGSS
jgi:hypothetical protein